MNDKKCYVCQMDTLKKYICKDCYFKLFREKEALAKAYKELLAEAMSLYRHSPNSHRKTAEEYFKKELDFLL